MTTLLLIRHGENDFLKKGRLPGHQPGIHLNERGCAQAQALAESLEQLPIKAIYASPLERAVETARPIARALKIEVELRPGLRDGDVGAWTGMEIKKLRKNPLWMVVQEAPSRARFPQGESILEVQTRIVNEIEAICEKHKKEMVAVIFHADPIKLVVTHYIGLPFDNFQRLAVQPGSVTILGIHGTRATLLALNIIPPFSFPKP
jgi:probable phosphoglycerate mutase